MSKQLESSSGVSTNFKQASTNIGSLKAAKMPAMKPTPGKQTITSSAADIVKK